VHFLVNSCGSASRPPIYADEGSLPQAQLLEPTMATRRPRGLIAHGWLGRAGQFRALALRLAEAGFDAAILSYPTMFGSFERAVELARRALDSGSQARLHLVGFSLGGLVMRALAAERPAGLVSLLLVGTPNAGSPIADLVGRFAPTPALRRLSTTAPALPTVDGILVGCIAGSRRGPMGLLFGEENDGRVAVSSALAISHHDARTIAVGHRALPFSAETATLALRFLRDGHF
jgi:pimeloyl-ACP methyl ester carboxylesterase